MSDILYKGTSYANKDQNFLDYLGIIFKNPEKGVDDQDNFQVIVPDEQPEISVEFVAGEAQAILPIEPETPIDESPEVNQTIEDEPVVVPEPPVVTPSEPTPTPIPEPEVLPEEEGE